MERKQWVERYMRELDRGRRKEILDRAISEEGSAPESFIKDDD